MSKQLKANVLHALFVAIICGVLVGIYAALPVEVPLYWAAFIILPTVFMYGGEWKQIPFHWLNLLVGLFLGGALSFFLTNQMAGALGLPLALGVATCVCTFLVQSLTNGVFAPGGIGPILGRCPMAFVGMITCFAAGGENYVVAIASLFVGVVFATLSAQSFKLAARVVGLEEVSEAKGLEDASETLEQA